MDGLARRPREVVGDAGDPNLLTEVFRGGVDGGIWEWEDFGSSGDGSLGGSFSCRDNLALETPKLTMLANHLDN